MGGSCRSLRPLGQGEASALGDGKTLISGLGGFGSFGALFFISQMRTELLRHARASQEAEIRDHGRAGLTFCQEGQVIITEWRNKVIPAWVRLPC